MQAKDATEVMRLQSDYLGRQMQALSSPGPGAWTKCRQNGGGCCQTSAVMQARKGPTKNLNHFKILAIICAMQ